MSKELEFLAINSSLIDPIIAAKFEVFRRFGNVQIELKLIKDEEIEDWKTLFFIISGDIEIKSLNIFLKEWAFSQTLEFKRKVTFSLS